MDVITVGNKIHSVRIEKDITLEDIALRIGVAKSTIQRYEAGKIKNPKLPVLESIANALNINPSWLVGKSDHKEVLQKSAPTILEYYNKLNDLGKVEATKRVQELTQIPSYADLPILMAAHNDNAGDPEEQAKIMSDLEKLKRPE